MITPQQLRNPQVKPKWQLPAGVMESVVAFNCRKYGFPRPVLAMPMWEGAGNRALDYSGHGNHGVLTDGPIWTADGLNFDAADSHVLCSNTGMTDAVYFISFSIYPTDVTSTQYSFDQTTNSAGRRSIVLGYQDGYFNYYDGGYPTGSAADTQIEATVDVLQHIIMGTDGTKVYGYKNGVKVVEETGDWESTGATNFYIGRGYNDFNGSIINNVLVFNIALSAAQAKFLSDNPYFMYQIPEELYGYVAAVGDTATNLLHGKIIIKDSSITLVDGLVKVQDTVTDLFDGELKVIEKVTSLADGKLQVQDIDTDLADGKLQVKDSTTAQADGKVQIQDTDTDLADGKVQVQDSVIDLADGKVIVTTAGLDTGYADGKIQIKDVTTGIVDGLVKVKDSVTGLADGKVKISNIASNLADGLIQIKDTATGIADGKVRIKDVATGTADGLLKIIEKATSNVDGKLKIKDTITDLADGKISITGAVTAVIRRITIANKKPSYRLVAEQPKPAYRLKTENK